MNVERLDSIHIALAANRRYLPGLMATAVSLVRSASCPERILFHVFSDGLENEDMNNLVSVLRRYGYERDIDFRTPDMDELKATFSEMKGSYTTYLRLFLPTVFPDLKWMVWIDVDTLWFQDVARLWDSKDESVSLLWCRDFASSIPLIHDYFESHIPGFDVKRYACAGVVLMNLAKLRKTGFILRCKRFVAENGTPRFHDQDLLNFLCYDDAKLIDDTWNLMNPHPGVEDGLVVHCVGAGSRFGRPYSDFHPIYELWFRYFAWFVEGRKERVAPFWQCLLFSICGMCYVPKSLCRILSWPFSHWGSAANLHRFLFYCWLGRRKWLFAGNK